MFSFDSPENIRKPLVFWCFQGDQKEALGRKGLKNVCQRKSILYPLKTVGILIFSGSIK